MKTAVAEKKKAETRHHQARNSIKSIEENVIANRSVRPISTSEDDAEIAATYDMRFAIVIIEQPTPDDGSLLRETVWYDTSMQYPITPVTRKDTIRNPPNITWFSRQERSSEDKPTFTSDGVGDALATSTIVRIPLHKKYSENKPNDTDITLSKARTKFVARFGELAELPETASAKLSLLKVERRGGTAKRCPCLAFSGATAAFSSGTLAIRSVQQAGWNRIDSKPVRIGVERHFRVVPGAGPAPIDRSCHQAANDRIHMDVVDGRLDS